MSINNYQDYYQNHWRKQQYNDYIYMDWNLIYVIGFILRQLSFNRACCCTSLWIVKAGTISAAEGSRLVDIHKLIYLINPASVWFERVDIATVGLCHMISYQITIFRWQIKRFSGGSNFVVVVLHWAFSQHRAFSDLQSVFAD